MRILIYGAGVIGSLYAVLLSRAGHDVLVYARGSRLETLRAHGLRYRNISKKYSVFRRQNPLSDQGTCQTANVKILSTFDHSESFDFILLAVRAEQVQSALSQLRSVNSTTIVTMVNTLQPYDAWESLCGRGRILPAFPGAGGAIHDGVLDASLTQAWIQKTTMGEIDGTNSPRLKRISSVFRGAGIPCAISRNMHAWQVSHVAMVVPLAKAYKMCDFKNNVHTKPEVVSIVVGEVKANFKALHAIRMLEPSKFKLLQRIPNSVLSWFLKRLYRSEFGERFMYQHSIKAGAEMRALKNALEEFLRC